MALTYFVLAVLRSRYLTPALLATAIAASRSLARLSSTLPSSNLRRVRDVIIICCLLAVTVTVLDFTYSCSACVLDLPDHGGEVVRVLLQDESLLVVVSKLNRHNGLMLCLLTLY